MKRIPFCLSPSRNALVFWFVLASVFYSCSGLIYAGCDDAVFGFNKYVKSSSQSAVFTENFPAANPSHNFTLLVFNGYNGADRISRGSIVINGVQVVSSSDFSQQVDSFEKPIGTLQANNIMQITLQQGGTGSFIVVQIIDRGSGLTSLSGRVLSTTDQPLEQAKLTVGRASTLTDRNGNFRLDSLPCGVQRVVVDGSGIKGQKTYASVTELLTLAEGILNVLPRAIYLPEINLATAVTVPSTVTSDIVVFNPAVPGVSLIIDAGTQVIYPDGATEGLISITEVPLDKAPLGLPSDQQPYKIVTIQPEGVVFTQPAAVTYPNVDNLQVVDRVQVMSSIPETGQFAPAGTATVDPSCVCPISDPGSGLSASGWCYLIPEYPRERNPNPDRKKDPCKEAVGSEADVCNGALSAGHTLPSYRSLGVSRSVTLNYSSLAAQPRPILAAESTIYGYSAQPSTLSYQLAVNGVPREMSFSPTPRF